MARNSFAAEEYVAAKEEMNRWQGRTNETVDELVLRKRKAELRQLVKTVIKNELNHEQQLLVQLHWYEGLTGKEIAEKLSLSPSSVSKKLQKINDIIYEKLKYAVEYRFGKSFRSNTELIISENKAFCTVTNPKNISSRIINLRKEQCLTVAQLSTLTGIEEDRILKIEKKGSLMTMTELKKLSVFFKVTSDYILFGKD